MWFNSKCGYYIWHVVVPKPLVRKIFMNIGDSRAVGANN